MEFLLKLVDTSDFPARWHCGRWTPGHGWLHILSDLGIWSAYFAIPLVLTYFLARRQDLPFRKLFFLFAAFILLCGSTHLMEATIFWWPAYRLAGLLKLITAVVSWTTVFALVPIVPRVLTMRTPEELEREIEARNHAEAAMHQANADLERRVMERTAQLAEANSRLEGEREWFRTTLKSIGDAVITTDLSANVSMLNPVAESLTGWSSEEAIGQPLTTVFRIISENTRETVENPVTKSLRLGSIVGLANHTLLISRDGSERPIDDSAAPIRTEAGDVLGCVLVFRDIADRKHAETALRESEDKFRNLADNISQLAWMADGTGWIFWYNKRWFDYTGTTLDEMQGWGWKAVHHPDHVERVIQKFQQHLDNGEPWEDTFPLRGVDGEYRWYLSRALPIRKPDGAILRWFGTNTDITELRDLQGRLQHVAEELSEVDRRKDEFLAILAHELRNPLAPIRNGLDLLKLVKHDPRQIADLCETMERQTQQLIVLVNDLLDVARIRQGKFELHKMPVNLADVVRNAVETSKPGIQEGGHALKIELPDRPVAVFADPNRLAQVLSNLLNNSSKYTPEGGHITLAAQREQEAVVITVTDTGAGIPADMLDRIFELFAQIDRPLERTYTGLGIGLTLAKQLVEMHGGSITVHSAGPNRGSEFSIRLPIVIENASAAAVADEELSVAPVSGLRILVVDDNAAAAEMLCQVLRLLGNDVRKAADGSEALMTAAEFEPAVIFMDLGMPRMDGYEAARQVRQLPGGQNVMLVAVTGWGQDDDRQRTTAAGFDEHLVKPAALPDLRRILARRGAKSQG